MLAIFKREFKSLFWNITGWLFIGITLALFGLYFFVYNLSYGYLYILFFVSHRLFIYGDRADPYHACFGRGKTCQDRPVALDGTDIRRKDRTW